jgi:nucleotide-binding universal stress UspA family protein
MVGNDCRDHRRLRRLGDRRRCAGAGGGLAEACAGRLLVVYVYDGRFTDITPGTAEAIAANADAILDRARAQLDPDLRSELAAVSEGSPAAILHALAESERADLIVVGSRRLGPLARVSAGSVSGPVLHGAPCPAFASRAKSRLRPAASCTCCRLSVPGRSRWWPAPPPSPTRYSATWRSASAATPRLPVARLAGELPVAIEIERGDAAAELIARSGDVDLIVLGSRSYGPLRRVLVGGVGTKVIAEARCPVLVVPRSAGTA